MVRPTLDDPFYYLHNFRFVLDWLERRYADLFDAAERDFLSRFPRLPVPAQALLVRMVMRKGRHFRAATLDYAEIGPVATAVAPLLARGWVSAEAALSLEELFALLPRADLARLFAEPLAAAGLRRARKAQWREALGERFAEPRPPRDWGLDAGAIYTLELDALCERLRLMFFGNLRQDWSTFVLAELGRARYETVAFPPEARAFAGRADVDTYLQLQRCRERLEAGEAVATLRAEVPPRQARPWLEARRARLLYRLGRDAERGGELAEAEALYAESTHPEARCRRLRVLERSARHERALALAEAIAADPRGDIERRQARRIQTRLHRRLGRAPLPAAAAPAVATHTLELAPGPGRVEWTVREHLAAPEAPVHYVENGLIPGLFGLLCWEAIFAPLPGAFFHPFQRGPADLAQGDFRARRAALFEACLARLDDGTYRDAIRRHHRDKAGLQSPFVDWALLDGTLLERALACLPAAHLRLCFERLLQDPVAHRAGLPDLIQFWPDERRYRMLEVKGPGDRLQDNQRHWLEFFARHDLPAAVCHVRWRDMAS